VSLQEAGHVDEPEDALDGDGVFVADTQLAIRIRRARIDALIEEIETLDFDQRAAATYGRVRAQLEAGGTPIGPNGMLIAAHALSHGLTVVTDSTSEFKSVKV